jgi:hypothetical protein
MRSLFAFFLIVSWLQCVAVRSQETSGIDSDFLVARGQFTFNSEGVEVGPLPSRQPRVPSKSSGVMIGRGYDLGKRQSESIVKDLLQSGLSQVDAQAYGGAAGLTGEEAERFLKANRSKLVEITKTQQKRLFELMYDETVAEVHRISGSKVDWRNLDPRIEEVLVDLMIRGDYTNTTDKLVQKSVINNDFAALKSVMEREKNWASIPRTRFERGVNMMKHLGNTSPKDRVNNRLSGVIKLPKNVPSWVRGDVKNLDDIAYKIDGGKGADRRGSDPKGTGNGNNNTGSNGDKDPKTKELSGSVWVSRFPTSVSLNDLDATFKENITNFQSALKEAGASYTTHATKRPKERAYLMHWSWRIVKENYNAKSVPELEGVNIEWWHGDQAKSKQAAQEMVNGYEIGNLGTKPALNSRHIQGKAIDMSVTWSGNLTIKRADGTKVVISSTPRDATNPDLIAVGATYGAIHYSPAAKDKNHWSTDGK